MFNFTKYNKVNRKSNPARPNTKPLIIAYTWYSDDIIKNVHSGNRMIDKVNNQPSNLLYVDIGRLLLKFRYAISNFNNVKTNTAWHKTDANKATNNTRVSWPTSANIQSMHLKKTSDKALHINNINGCSFSR